MADPVLDPPPPNPTPTPSGVARFFQKSWPSLAVVLIIVVVILVSHKDLAVPSLARSCVVFILTAGILIAANFAFFPDNPLRTGPEAIPYVISFDCLTAIVVGLAATVLACPNWETAFLLAGSCLMIGGFFGLLFGYPQGVAQQAVALATPAAAAAANGPGPVPANAPPAATQPPPSHGKNLLADSAATLGKVITGFTLAKMDAAWKHYSSLCTTIGPALGILDPKDSHVLAGVIISYFLATGFLSGLFLPTYFMSDHF